MIYPERVHRQSKVCGLVRGKSYDLILQGGSIVKKLLKDESGGVMLVEASYLFPIIIAVMGVLIFMGFYILQSVLIYTQAQKIASVAAKELALPGYEVIGKYAGKTAKTDFENSTYFTSGNVKSVYDAKKSDIYRYIKPGDPIKKENRNSLEQSLKTLVIQTQILDGSSVSCQVSAKNYFITQEVEVKVTKNWDPTSFFTFFGINRTNTKQVVTARAASCDGAEFVRNTDIVYDITTFLCEKLKISDKITSITQKIRDSMNKLK